jgi:hypothetical protein
MGQNEKISVVDPFPTSLPRLQLSAQMPASPQITQDDNQEKNKQGYA